MDGKCLVFDLMTRMSLNRNIAKLSYKCFSCQKIVEKLAFVVENHFTLEGKDFHQIEFQYLVTPLSEPNHQMKESGQVRDCQWVSLDDLESINLNPAFLKQALTKLEGPVRHVINKD